MGHEPIKVTKEKQEVDFQRALYAGKCGVCGESLSWEASFDADGTSYYAECCQMDYYMSPSKVIVQAEQK